MCEWVAQFMVHDSIALAAFLSVICAQFMSKVWRV